jgi:hypothetical protein
MNNIDNNIKSVYLNKITKLNELFHIIIGIY